MNTAVTPNSLLEGRLIKSSRHGDHVIHISRAANRIIKLLIWPYIARMARHSLSQSNLDNAL
jgi:hypothetical protein